MIDNSENRLHDIFFYGLYMDPEILEEKGVVPRNPRVASVENYQLRIANKATLLRVPGATAHGLVYALTHAEIHCLYWGAGLHAYAAEALLARVGQEQLAVLCCNLTQAPESHESNPQYSRNLATVMKKLGVPCDLR